MNALLKKLTKLLESNDLELRTAAIRVITEIGFSSKPVIQSLGRCLREPHDDLRLAALRALARLGARDVAQMVVPLILASGPLREQAMAVISAVGPSVIPQLKVLYPEADFHGKRAVISALSRIGGKPALQFLLSILPGEAFELQKHLTICLCEALDRLTPAHQSPLYSLVARLLRSKELEKHPQVLVTAAVLLGHFRGGPLVTRARGDLRALVDRRHAPEVRRHALVSFHRTLGEVRLSPQDEQLLWKCLADEDWHNIAQHALSSFQQLDVPKKQLPRLIELLHHSPHFSVHIHIFERLQGSDRPEVAEAILPFLADSRFRVREAAEAALRKMPTSIESLFALLMKTEDLEVTQRINAILRDFPQETRQKYVDRAAQRLLALFDENDLHYKSFLDFVKSLDPEPLRKKIYEKAQTLKKGKSRDKFERMASLLQILWDNHLITAEGRYLLAIALVKSSPKDLAPASRRANLGLRVIRALIYDNYDGLVKRLTHDKDLDSDDYFYLGFHFSEEGDEMRPFSTAMLEHVVKKYPKAKVSAPAAQKLHLQAKALEAALEAKRAAEEEARKKELRKLKKAGLLPPQGVAGSGPAEGAGSPTSTGVAPATPGAARGAAKPLAGAKAAPSGGKTGTPAAKPAASSGGPAAASRPKAAAASSGRVPPAPAQKAAARPAAAAASGARGAPPKASAGSKAATPARAGAASGRSPAAKSGSTERNKKKPARK